MPEIEDIEGIGPAYAAKLKGAGVGTVEALLAAAATADGRAQLAEKSGFSTDTILKWVNHADLYRVKGIGSEMADLLVECGIDSPVELAQRNAANCVAKLAEVNATKNLVRQLPSEATVQKWIDDAATLAKIVSH